MAETEITLTAQTPPLAIPANLMTKQNEDLILGLVREAKVLKISDAEAFRQGSERLNQLGRSRKFVKDAVIERRAPFTKAADDVSALGKPMLDGIVEAEAALNVEMVAYRRIEEEARAKAEQERQRLAELARQAQEAARRAEAQRLQLEEEAKRRQEAAAAKVQEATTDEEFNTAAAAFDEGLAKDAQAAALLIPQVPVELLAKPGDVVVPQVAKAKGAKMTRTAVIESTDPELLARTYLVPDETKIKRHILDGTITAKTPGVKFRIEEKFSGTGR